MLNKKRILKLTFYAIECLYVLFESTYYHEIKYEGELKKNQGEDKICLKIGKSLII